MPSEELPLELAFHSVLKFKQPTVPISTNETDRQAHAGRGGGYKVGKWKKAWQEAAFYAWKEQRLGEAGEALGQPCSVKLHLGFHANRRRDPSNYVGTVTKWVVDGLVLAGLWPDDDPAWVQVLEPALVIHSKVPTATMLKCEVHLTPKGV